MVFWCAITDTYPDFNYGLAKPPLKSRHGYVIVSDTNGTNYLFMPLPGTISVSKMGPRQLDYMPFSDKPPFRLTNQMPRSVVLYGRPFHSPLAQP